MKKFLFALVLLQFASVGHAVKAERDISESDGSMGPFKYETEEDLHKGTERQEEQDDSRRRVNKRSLKDDIDASEEMIDDRNRPDD